MLLTADRSLQDQSVFNGVENANLPSYRHSIAASRGNLSETSNPARRPLAFSIRPSNARVACGRAAARVLIKPASTHHLASYLDPRSRTAFCEPPL